MRDSTVFLNRKVLISDNYYLLIVGNTQLTVNEIRPLTLIVIGCKEDFKKFKKCVGKIIMTNINM